MPQQSSSKLQLALGTGAFALCFAVFGSMSAMMPIISKHMALTPVQKSIAIAIPVKFSPTRRSSRQHGFGYPTRRFWNSVQ